jgi:hypothetical protein
MSDWRNMLRQILLNMTVMVAFVAVEQSVRTIINEKIRRRMASKTRGNNTDTTLSN